VRDGADRLAAGKYDPKGDQVKALVLSLFLLLWGGVATPAKLQNPSFVCETYGDELHCQGKAVSDFKRPPQWELYPEGQGYTDVSRGWNVTLYPPKADQRYMVLMRVYTGSRILIVTCHTADGKCKGPDN
jgi:hypothetical protein